MTSEQNQIELAASVLALAQQNENESPNIARQPSIELEGGSIETPPASPEIPFVANSDLPESIIVRAKLKPNYRYLHLYSFALGIGVW